MIAISVIVKFFVPDSVAPVPNVRRRVVMIQKRLTLDEFIVVKIAEELSGDSVT